MIRLGSDRIILAVAAIGWIMCGVLAIVLYAQTQRLDLAKAKSQAMESQLDAARASAARWQATGLELRQKLADEIEARRIERQKDIAAIKAAEEAKRDADRTLRAWLDRYAAATRSAECLAIELMPICEVSNEH